MLLAGLALVVAAGAGAVPRPVLTIAVQGNGRVTGTPGRIACAKACRVLEKAGAVVRLTARPAAGSTFAGWAGACRGKTAACTVHVRASARVVASFKAAPPPPPPAPPPAPAPPPGFTPAVLAGTWNGSWQNQTFGSSGSAQLVVTTPTSASFTFQFSLGGRVFGCSTPPATSGVITEGSGANQWNADGFSIQTKTGSGGSATLQYVFKTGALTGSGVSGCNNHITWTIAGTFTGSSFSGTVTISLPGGITATSVVTLSR